MRNVLLMSTLLAAGLQTASAQPLEYTLLVGGHHYDVEALDGQFEQAEITTTTTWTPDQEHTFRGPYLSSVLKDQGLNEGAEVTLTAMDDYAVDVPVGFIMKYQPILATSMDGKRLSFADKGPVRVIWPRSDYPDQLGTEFDGYWPWYLLSVTSTLNSE